MALSDYNNERYLAALTSISSYVELLLMRNLTQSNTKNYSKVPFHVLLRESLEQNLLSKNMVTKLNVFWKIRNKAIQYGSNPSKNDIKVLMELAKTMEQTFLLQLESLTERDRSIIASRFMERLCELDSEAINLNLSREFTIDQIWDNYLGARRVVIAFCYW